MSALMSKMTSASIKTRLSELADLQSAHAARDLDAEVAATMRAGGDLDALEAVQLDAERAARRIRVEIAALTAELPEALKREGSAAVADIAEKHETLKSAAGERANAVCAAWDAFKVAAIAWRDTQLDAEGLTLGALKISEQTGAALPSMGTFRSTAVMQAYRDALSTEPWEFLRSADSDMRVGMGVASVRVD